jgi:hypothetical protein
MNIRQALQQQLELTSPCSGDFLAGMSREEKITASTKDLQLTPERAARYVDQKIAEWSAHKGERQLYIIIQRTSPTPQKVISLTVEKVWESEIDKFGDDYCVVHLSPKDGIPTVEHKVE